MRNVMILIVLLAACDRKPQSPEQALVKVRETRAERLKASEGKTFYAALLTGATEINIAHASRDCKNHQDEINTMGRGADANKKMFREVQLQLKGGKFIDGAGAAHEPWFCDKCYR
jgi:hypothetical protein